MARNTEEQIAYLLKRRRGGMSDADYEKQLRYLHELGYDYGRDQEAESRAWDEMKSR